MCESDVRYHNIDPTLYAIYLDIFQASSDDVELLSVRDMGKSTTCMSAVHKFIGVVRIPCRSEIRRVELDDNVMTMLRNDAQRRHRGVGQVDFSHEVKWNKIGKDGKEKTKHFTFSGFVSPLSVLKFMVKGDSYYVWVELFGVFG